MFEDLSTGEWSVEQIAKKNRLPEHSIQKAVNDLKAEEIVGGPDSKMYLTAKGVKMVAELRRAQQDGAATSASLKTTGKDHEGNINSVDKRRHIEDRRV